MAIAASVAIGATARGSPVPAGNDSLASVHSSAMLMPSDCFPSN